MSKLGKAEKQYCLHHGIPLDRLFDADGYRPYLYNKIMEYEEKWAAYGVTPCRKNGHILRNRHGTCLMCDPQTVAHMLRSKLPGYLYIATGGDRELMKLGFSQNPAERISIANYEGWGGYSDWRLIAQAWSAEAGKLESQFHQKFRDTQVALPWVRNGIEQTTREAFIADAPEACSELVWLCDDPPVIFA